jgi:hypothetical protein
MSTLTINRRKGHVSSQLSFTRTHTTQWTLP